MKIETPSIRRSGARAFFHGACSVFCALVLTVVMLERSTTDRFVEDDVLLEESCCVGPPPEWRTPVRVQVTAAGNWRIRGDGFDQIVGRDGIVSELTARLANEFADDLVRISVGGEEDANWGEVYEVWQRLRAIPRTRVSLDWIARRSVL